MQIAAASLKPIIFPPFVSPSFEHSSFASQIYPAPLNRVGIYAHPGPEWKLHLSVENHHLSPRFLLSPSTPLSRAAWRPGGPPCGCGGSAGGGQPGGPVVKVETKAESKGLEDRVTGWIRRHWLLSIGGGLALFLAYLHLAGGVETKPHAQIDMPCAGHGYHARLHFGSFTRIDGNVSGDVNPGNSEISVWDESRRCWARRIVSVELGHRQRVDCAWVLVSSDCLTGDP